MMSERLTAIIPAGGEATRLRPHTHIEQKPMLPMGAGKRIIDWALDIASQTDRTFVTLHHKETLTRHLEDYISERPGVCALRDRLRMGAASLIDFSDMLFEDDLLGDSIILPADHVIEGLDLKDFYKYHKESNATLTVLTTSKKDYGQYIHLADGVFAESIHSDYNENDDSSCGIYIIKNRELLRWAQFEITNGWNGEMRSLLTDFVEPAIYRGGVVAYKLPDGGYWDDAGTIGRYYHNNMRLSKGESVVDKESFVHPDATIRRSIVIGRAVIEANVVLDKAVYSSDGLNHYQTSI